VGLTFRKRTMSFKGPTNIIVKEKTFSKYGRMGMYMWYQLQKCKKALWDICMKTGDILGYIKPIVYVKANIGGEACNWRFNNLLHNAWCVIRFVHHLMHPPHIYCLYWSLILIILIVSINGVWILLGHWT